MSSFADLGLGSAALKAVGDLGYEQPTPVQEKAIPLVLEGRDVIVAAQTGTGKTAAFALPCLDKLEPAGKGAGPAMLIITPTRELAAQIGGVCQTVAKRTKHSVLTVVGGLSYRPQIEGLRRGCDVLIATPGRLEDLIGQDAADLSLVTTLVLDEADRMLDMGFLPSVNRIAAATNPERQTLLFSATIDKEVRRVSQRMMRDPELVEVAREGETADTVKQYVVHIAHAAKPSCLAAVLKEYGGDRVIVFARTRYRAEAACRRIKKAGFKADVIHSGRSQNQRKKALEQFAESKIGVLIATDVLSRGIDVDRVSYVVNYDLPETPEDYIHRIGRTGRAGQEGMAISFVSPENKANLKEIQKLTKQRFEEIEVAGYDKEKAEEEAADRVLQNSLRREKDPEVAQVMKEMAAADKAKRKKQQRAQESRERGKSRVDDHSERGKSRGKGPTEQGKKNGHNKKGNNKKGNNAADDKARSNAKTTGSGSAKAAKGTAKTEKQTTGPKVVKAAKGDTKTAKQTAGSNVAKAEKGIAKSAAKGSAKQSRKQARASQNDIVAFGEKQSGIKRKRDRAARMAEDDKYLKRVSAGRPPAKATGKAAKISAERYEARLAAVEEDHSQHRRRMKAKYSTAKGTNSKKGDNSKSSDTARPGYKSGGTKRPGYKSSGTRKHK